MAASSFASDNQFSAFIDRGSEFEGKLSFKNTVRIDGRFRGEIASESILVVGEPGEIEASVRSREVVVSGSITGTIHATERLTLHKSARIEGDVEAGCLIVEEGAVLNGRLTMPKANGARRKASGDLDPHSD